jgi:outer membrane receptor for ferrienterochelin and colicins
MKHFLLFTFILSTSINIALGQHTFRVKVIDANSKNPIPAVSVQFLEKRVGGLTDADGLVYISGIPTGQNTLKIMAMGYESHEQKLVFPMPKKSLLVVALKAAPVTLNGVQVTATRTNTYIEQIPIRVEVLGLEDIEEKTAEAPSNVGHFLNETSGIHLQTTSLLTGGVQVRMQGLPGRYTQVLKDGLPMFGGYGNSLSLMQLPPLDLKQVEVIKGASSVYYGADAMAGMINFVSKKPTDKVDAQALLSQTQRGGTDMGAWYSGKIGGVGLTFLATAQMQGARDIDGDGFTDLQRVQQFTINPKVFYDIDRRNHIEFGITHTTDNRIGGSIDAVNGGEGFKQENASSRTYTSLKFVQKDVTGGIMTVKNSFHFYNRNTAGTTGNFNGKQLNTYTEISYDWKENKHRVILGGALVTDNFSEAKQNLDYYYRSFGAFFQDDWTVLPQLTVQAGIRGDYVWKTFPTIRSRGEDYILPRLSALYKVSDDLTVRLGGGTGYKMPSVFMNETELLGLQNIIPLSETKPKPETSVNINGDVQHHRIIGDWRIDVNQALFFTSLKNAMLPVAAQNTATPNAVQIQNDTRTITVIGAETNVQVSYKNYKGFLAYTFTDAQRGSDPLTYTPKNKLVATAIYESEKNYKIGLEVILTGKQYLDNNLWGQSYGMIGIMGQRDFGRYSVVFNIENLTDVRQTRWGKVVENSTSTLPTLLPIYAPLEGVLANVALRVKL